MGNIVILAEKPSVGRDIARALGCKTANTGYIQGEGYIVTWAIGHLVGLCEPDELDEKYKVWRKGDLPILPEEIPLKTLKGAYKQYQVIKKLITDKQTDSLICATDSGREGELIFRFIYTYAKCKKPFTRLWISSLTQSAILDGMRNLRPGADYDGLYQSALCRSKADWLVGMNATRMYTLQYSVLLSVGRVQTPTLALIVQRQLAINAFVPQPYWELWAKFEGYDGIWTDEKGNTRILDEDMGKELKKRLSKETVGTVHNIKTERISVIPPLLLDLTELQRQANRRFGFSAKKTLDIAQALYETKKLITYPRTDSRYITTDLRPQLKGALESLQPKYGTLVSALGETPQIHPRIVNNARVPEHHAIIPTGRAIPTLTNDEQSLFDLIARSFIAAFYPNYEYDKTDVITQIQTEHFATTGRITIARGWHEPLLVQEDSVALPPLTVGQQVALHALTLKKLSTKPPLPYTEATLLTAMEHAGREIDDEDLREQMKESGLGTPATRAAIIERLLQVGYLVRHGKQLAPTAKGMQLVSIVPPELASAITTGKWERALLRISKGEMEPERFMQSIHRFVLYLCQQAQTPTGVVFEKSPPKKTTRKTSGTQKRKTTAKLSKTARSQ